MTYNTHDMPEKVLIERLKEDPHGNFELLMQRYCDGVYKLALRWTGHRQDAEEILQQTFINAYVSLQRRPTILKPQAWLYKIAWNLCNDLHKVSARRPPSISLYTPEGNPLDIEDAERLDSLVAGAEQVDEILEALLQLPLAYQEIAFLFFVEEFSRKEIAQQLHKPLETVKSAIQRSRILLRKSLKIPATEEK